MIKLLYRGQSIVVNHSEVEDVMGLLAQGWTLNDSAVLLNMRACYQAGKGRG